MIDGSANMRCSAICRHAYQWLNEKLKEFFFKRSLVWHVCVRIHRAHVSAGERVQMRESPVKCVRFGRSEILFSSFGLIDLTHLCLD